MIIVTLQSAMPCIQATCHHPYINTHSLSLTQARKDSIIAEVKWFYRVSELPEAVYRLLMEDRKKCKHPISTVQ